MSLQGEKISEIIRSNIKIINDQYDFNKIITRIIANELRDKYIGAIADGIFDYINNYYEWDVKTNGVIQTTSTPPVTIQVVTNRSTKGNISTLLTSDNLKQKMLSDWISSNKDIIGTKKIFESIDFLLNTYIATETGDGTDPTPPTFSVGPVGIGTCTWLAFVNNYISCDNQLALLTKDSFNFELPPDQIIKPVWDIIGDNIYIGLNNNTINIVDAGTATSPSGVYVGVANGKVVYGTERKI